MASYHCSVKVGKAGKGAAHSAYISRDGKYEAMRERRAGEELVHTEHGNMPKWAASRPLTFWEEADARERKNGSVYRELEVALPRELTREQQVELVRDLVKREIGDKHAYQWAIHCPRAAMEKGEQPHAHIMWSERTLDHIERDPETYFKRANKQHPERGGCPKADRFSGGKTGAERREAITAIRASVAEVQNTHLARAGHAVRVDHRSLKDQGIDRQPERHLGPKVIQTLSAATVGDLLSRRALEGERARAAREVGELDLSGDLAKAIRDRSHEAAQVKPPAPSMREMLARLAALTATPQQEPTPEPTPQPKKKEQTPAERLAELIQRQPAPKPDQPKLDLSGNIAQAKADARARLEASLPDVRARLAERAQQAKAEKEARERAEAEARQRAEAEAKQAKTQALEQQKRTERTKDRDNGPSLSW